jgi:uncharacterized protein YdeI (YjbR/CyaY-like superfamily)
MSDAYEQVEITSRDGWRAWLSAHHQVSPGVWGVIWKKTSGGPYVPYDDVVDEAIAFGWVDSLVRKLDDRRSQLLLTPRKPKSSWSRVNKDRVARLIAAGTMTEAGLAAVEIAKANGAWTALDAVEQLIEPDDLRAALDAVPSARRHWDAFPRSTRRGILEWIGTAKKPETRARRVGETARLAADNVRANEYRPKGS